jgi:hypothetical protein
MAIAICGAVEARNVDAGSPETDDFPFAFLISISIYLDCVAMAICGVLAYNLPAAATKICSAAMERKKYAEICD